MRTEGDSWSITTGVGSTALYVAMARAIAGREPDPLAVDPFAEVFVRAAGPEWAAMLDGAYSGNPVTDSEFARVFRQFQIARTRYFDDYFAAAMAAGIRQVVILAAGLDARAYRLDWPDGTVVYELDRPQVLEFKRETLSAKGDKPRADRREVAADLREDWPKALREQGFDPASPTAWLVEGLLIYLQPAAQDELFTALDALSAAGSRVAVEQMDPLTPQDLAAIEDSPESNDTGGEEWTKLIYNDPRQEVAAWLAERGWRAERTYVGDYLRAHGRSTAGLGPQARLLPARVSLVTGIRE
ncbi:class I SAM-dependent methyltransferase [Nocardia sp. NEAU-G5]|uniref:S-adenosyl-L-methionine-dependent methyltransferase n=1 Tax=Nocardia albiluteola TaxID=2842303 RepID=A0ABS6AWC9_9NOCA|nr:class I SAM-dependent methyltransferase [Nocardia albiluteola]MBU3061816.1 class I SAM-dependent methyltransferase [Nocardia albiluteola]